LAKKPAIGETPFGGVAFFALAGGMLRDVRRVPARSFLARAPAGRAPSVLPRAATGRDFKV
jgi:hypothetical protein